MDKEKPTSNRTDLCKKAIEHQTNYEMLKEEAKNVGDQILNLVDDKPVLIGNGLLLDWAERLQAIAAK